MSTDALMRRLSPYSQPVRSPRAETAPQSRRRRWTYQAFPLVPPSREAFSPCYSRPILMQHMNVYPTVHTAVEGPRSAQKSRQKTPGEDPVEQLLREERERKQAEEDASRGKEEAVPKQKRRKAKAKKPKVFNDYAFYYLDGAHYRGRWVDPVGAHGKGTLTCRNGDIYVGGFRENQYHGLGVYQWVQGDRFEGRWVNGVVEKKGIYHYASGAKIEAEWKDGKVHGKGLCVFKDGRTFEGEWKNDMKDGFGRIETQDGVFEGHFQGGEIKGRGRYEDHINGIRIDSAWNKGGRQLPYVPQAAFVYHSTDYGDRAFDAAMHAHKPKPDRLGQPRQHRFGTAMRMTKYT